MNKIQFLDYQSGVRLDRGQTRAAAKTEKKKMRCNGRGGEWNVKQSRAGSVIARSLFLPPIALASF